MDAWCLETILLSQVDVNWQHFLHVCMGLEARRSMFAVCFLLHPVASRYYRLLAHKIGQSLPAIFAYADTFVHSLACSFSLAYSVVAPLAPLRLQVRHDRIDEIALRDCSLSSPESSNRLRERESGKRLFFLVAPRLPLICILLLVVSTE